MVGRRGDGRRLLRSLVAFAGACDRLAAEPAAALELSVHGPFARAVDGGLEDNLVLRAARLLQARLGGGRGARMRLDKNLPVSAGLGGGSSDAAAALRLLAQLWDVPSGEPALAAAAREAGADVPACLAARPALVSGAGEVVAPIAPLPDCGVVLANPGVPLPTAAAFSALEDRAAAPPAWRPPRDLAGLAGSLDALGNDLYPAALSIAPAAAEARAALAATPSCLHAGMSGSGATCFGLYPDAAAARAAAAALERAAGDGWWIVATELRKEPPRIEAA